MFCQRGKSEQAMIVLRQILERLITHLRRWHKVRHRITGYVRFSSRLLYEEYHLHKVPISSGWKKLYALQ
jgi:hypothetical protein